jgi:hypothetical protein
MNWPISRRRLNVYIVHFDHHLEPLVLGATVIIKPP